jgi:hypothetical protein
VIDDEIDGHERLDHFCVFAHGVDGGAHSGEVNEQRHAGEILKHDTGYDEGDFIVAWVLRVVVREVLDILIGDLETVVIAEQRFQHDPDGNGEFGKVRETVFGESGEGVEFALCAGACGECADVAHGWCFSKKEILFGEVWGLWGICQKRSSRGLRLSLGVCFD